MINLLKKYKWIMIVAAIPYMAIMFFLVKPVNYTIDLPGDIEKVESLIKIDDSYDEKGSFNTTSVWVLDKCTMFQRYFFENVAEVAVYETPEHIVNLSPKDYSMQGKISHDTSITASLINGYKAAGKTINYHYAGTYIWDIGENTTGLKIGDIVLADSSNEALEILRDYRDGLIDSFEILRDDKILDATPSNITGTSIYYDYYVIDSSSPNYSIKSSTSSGSSGGLLQSLAVFNCLTEFDYTFGKKIAGTGTIDVLGNVGGIGAVEQKIYTAIYNKVDIFFVPSDNYAAAKKVYDKFDTNMELIKVETIDDAISYLEGLK